MSGGKVNTSFVLYFLSASLSLMSQNQINPERLREETEVTITKYGNEEAKTILTKGYPIATNDSTIYFINSGHLPNILKAEIPAEQIDAISWTSRQAGSKDKKQMRKVGSYGILIGGAVGFGIAAILDANGVLQKEEAVGYFCNPDENTYSIFPPCEKSTSRYAYLVVPPIGCVLGYFIGREIGKNLKSNNLEINRNPLRWNELRDQIPLISIGVNLN